MRGFRLWVVVVLLAGCGKDAPKPKKPAPKPAPGKKAERWGPLPMVTEDWTGALDADSTLVLRFADAERVDREFGWLLEYLDVRAGDLGLGLGLKLGPDGWGSPRFVRKDEQPTATGVKIALPEGTVGGIIRLRSFIRHTVDRFAGALPRPVGPVVRQVLAPLDALEECRWTAGETGDHFRLDARITVRKGSKLDDNGLKSLGADMLARLPRAGLVTIYSGGDQSALLEHLEPLVKLAGALPGTASLGSVLGPGVFYGRGVAACLDWSDRGFELVVIANARDVAAFMTGFRQSVSGLPIEFSEPKNKTVDGVAVREFAGDIRMPEPKDPGPLFARSGYHAFEAQSPDAARVKADAERVTAALAKYRDVTVLFDSRHIFVRASRSMKEEEALRDAQNVLSGATRVQFRLAIRPTDRDFAKYKARLDPNGPRRQDIPPDARFKAGLAWLEVRDGWLLVALDDPGLKPGDFAWVYVSSARLGENAPTRDVSFRLKDDAVLRWVDLARESDLAVLFDGLLACVVAGADVHTVGDFSGLPKDLAAYMAAALRSPRLHHVYKYVGVKSGAFARREEIDREAKERLFPGGMRTTIGAVDQRVFVVISNDDGLVRAAIRGARGQASMAPDVRAALDRAGGEADFFVRVDMEGVMVRFFTATRGFLDPPDEEAIRKGLAGLGSCVVAGRQKGQTIGVMLEADTSVREFILRIAAQHKRTTAESQLSMLRVGIESWQRDKKTDTLPDLKVIEYAQEKDPWGTPFRARQTVTGFVVESAGPDRKFGTEDDLSDSD